MKKTKLSSEEIKDVFFMKRDGVPIVDICKKYKIDYSYVYKIVQFFTGKRKPKTYFSKEIDDKLRLYEFVSKKMGDYGSLFRIVCILNKNDVFSPEDISNLNLKKLKYTYNIGKKTMDDLREIKGLPRLCEKSKLIFEIGTDTAETKKRYGYRQILAIQEFLDDFNSTRKDDEQIIIYEKR